MRERISLRRIPRFTRRGNDPPEVIERRKLQGDPFMAYFESLADVRQSVGREAYAGLEAIARQRLARRDEDDWPVLGAALALRCPI